MPAAGEGRASMRSFPRLPLALLAAALAAACTFLHPDNSKPLDSAVADYADKTILFAGGGHGYQVEYYAPDGSAYLWYPGNERTLRGAWKVEEGELGNRLCFRYGANTYNPVTKTRGDSWECVLLGDIRLMLQEEAEGDILYLATNRSVPFDSKRKRLPSFEVIFEVLGPRRLQERAAGLR